MTKTCSNCRASVFVKVLYKNICLHHDGAVIQSPLKLAENCQLYCESAEDEEKVFGCKYFGLVER
jgi:hypothetical protein